MSSKQSFISSGFIARILLGLGFLVFGLNFFLHFLPSPPPDPSTDAGKFLGGLFASGYFFVFLKLTETIFGALLLINLFTRLVLLLLLSITLNILLFHIFLAPTTEGLVIAILLFALNIYLIWLNRRFYLPLIQFSPKTPENNAAV